MIDGIMDMLNEVNWVWVTVIYMGFMIVMWKMTFYNVSEESANLLRTYKIIFSVIMAPIIVAIVHKMGD